MSEIFEKILEKMIKNEWSQIDPESFWGCSCTSRASKNMIKQHFKRSGSFRKIFKISTKTYHSDHFLDVFFKFSSCWRMCCLAAGLEAILKWLVEHISRMLYRVIRGQGWASLNHQKIRTFWLIWHLNFHFMKYVTVCFGWDVIFTLKHVILIQIYIYNARNYLF